MRDMCSDAAIDAGGQGDRERGKATRQGRGGERQRETDRLRQERRCGCSKGVGGAKVWVV